MKSFWEVHRSKLFISYLVRVTFSLCRIFTDDTKVMVGKTSGA